MEFETRACWLLATLWALLVMMAYGQNQTVVIHDGCDFGTATQYTLAIDSEIANNHKVEISQVSKSTCAHFCNINRNEMGEAFSCRAFGYQEGVNICYLYDKEAYQRGSTNSTEASSVFIFEKLCLTSSRTCTIIPAFERSSNRVLSGFTHIVLEDIPSKEACLSECLLSPEKHDFQCMSTMYYYDSKECMLNFESKTSPGVAEFFSNDTESYNVDYFDNICAIRKRDAGVAFNACPERSTPTFIRYNGTELRDSYIATYTDLSVSECLKRCNEAENITCNSVDYNSLNSSCFFPLTDTLTVPVSNHSDADPNSDQSHYQRYCIEGARLLCGGENLVSFDAVSDSQLPAEYLLLTFSGVSPEECLSLCLLDPSSRCRSVNYHQKTSLCRLNNATRSEADLLDVSLVEAPVVYYENLCHPANVTIAAEIVQTLTSMGEHGDNAFNATVSPKPKPTTPSMDLQPVCEYSDMRVRMVAERPFTGFVFAKNKFGSCRVDVENKAEIILPLQFPGFQGNDSPCGVVEIDQTKYSVIVVVTANDMGIPGLVTEGDRFFNITCDFTNSSSSLVTATGRGPFVSRRDAPALYPDGVVDIPSPLNMQLLRETTPGSQVRTAVLGELLNLDFYYYPGFNRTGVGLFVRQCNATRNSGPPPHPEPLILIDDGCPATAAKGRVVNSTVLEIPEGFRLPFTVFRFDGSNSVKISCAIDLCEKGCNPAQCAINGGRVASYGRKRRRRSFPNRGMARGKKTEPASVVFTVVDKLPQVVSSPEHRRGIGNSNQLGRVNFDKDPSRRYSEQLLRYDTVGQKRQVCLKRSAFLGAAAFLAVVCFAQVVVVSAYAAYHYVKHGEEKKSE